MRCGSNEGEQKYNEKSGNNKKGKYNKVQIMGEVETMKGEQIKIE